MALAFTETASASPSALTGDRSLKRVMAPFANFAAFYDALLDDSMFPLVGRNFKWLVRCYGMRLRSATFRLIFIDPLQLVKALSGLISGTKQMKRCQAMFEGKSPNEQCWAVTPPRGSSYHSTERRWAEDTLAQMGHDPGQMLAECEVFWRRKGWN